MFAQVFLFFSMVFLIALLFALLIHLLYVHRKISDFVFFSFFSSFPFFSLLFSLVNVLGESRNVCKGK